MGISFVRARCPLWVMLLVTTLSLNAQADTNQSTTSDQTNAAVARLRAMDWEDPSFVQLVKEQRTLPIPVRQNQGGSQKCGFYALSHVFSHFDASAPTGGQVYRRAAEKGFLWAENGESLGGHLYKTMREFGYRGEYGWGLDGGTIPYLKKMLGKGYGIIVAVRGTTDQGLPIHRGFFKAGGHFVAVEGFVEINGADYMIVKDSVHYSREPEYVSKHLEGSSLWPVKLFEAAWSFYLYVALKPV